mgnify:CR=1 FL=1
MVTYPLTSWSHPGDPDGPMAVEVCAGSGPTDVEHKTNHCISFPQVVCVSRGTPEHRDSGA